MKNMDLNYLKAQVQDLDNLINDEGYYCTYIAKTTLTRLLQNMQQAIDMIELDEIKNSDTTDTLC